MITLDCEQGSDEWFAARLGVVSASNFAKTLSSGTGRKTYMLQLAAESLTGVKADSYSNAAMEWGTANEPLARSAYEFETGSTVSEVGFCKLSDLIGASPDGLVSDDGLVEIKSPNTSTHIETVLSGKCPTKHKAQIQGQLWVTGRKWCDFVSFDPRVQSEKALFIVRVDRDDTYITDKLAPGVEAFVIELKAIIAKMGCPSA